MKTEFHYLDDSWMVPFWPCDYNIQVTGGTGRQAKINDFERKRQCVCVRVYTPMYMCVEVRGH